jgi:hypothetical protein
MSRMATIAGISLVVLFSVTTDARADVMVTYSFTADGAPFGMVTASFQAPLADVLFGSDASAGQIGSFDITDATITVGQTVATHVTIASPDANTNTTTGDVFSGSIELDGVVPGYIGLEVHLSGTPAPDSGSVSETTGEGRMSVIGVWSNNFLEVDAPAGSSAATPEPATLTLALLGLGGLVGARLARRRAARR